VPSSAWSPERDRPVLNRAPGARELPRMVALGAGVGIHQWQCVGPPHILHSALGTQHRHPMRWWRGPRVRAGTHRAHRA
jgi:hypothetical protein